MGLNAPSGEELASDVVAGNFTATGQSTARVFQGPFNFSLWGTFVGTVQLERSFDGGTTFLPCAQDVTGTTAAYTAPCSIVNNEPESGVYYRFNCTAFTSGTINYRLSGGLRLT